MLDLVSPHVDCIRVFEIDDEPTGYYKLHDRNAPTYNRITHQLVGRYANAEWFHYDALGRPRRARRWSGRDKLHHNGAGQVQIARLMRDVANSCDPDADTPGRSGTCPTATRRPRPSPGSASATCSPATPTAPTGPRSATSC